VWFKNYFWHFWKNNLKMKNSRKIIIFDLLKIIFADDFFKMSKRDCVRKTSICSSQYLKKKLKSILSTFYEQLLQAKIPKAQIRQSNHQCLLVLL